MRNECSPKCSQCGAAIPENAPAGLCPKCLMALNLKTETVLTADTPGGQAPLPPEQIAAHFPQLEIVECLGRGGMGVVYKARQKTLNRVIALKLLAPERVNDPKFAERFAREAQALAALNHPNIVTVHDFGQAGGFYFLLMEFVDGANLRELLRARKFTPEEALAIVPALCDALQFAHERGIVHRDIKPENILLDRAGRVKIADFGIAKMLGAGESASAGETLSHESITQTGIGTPGYSAPEQKTSPQRVDRRADIYSLGVVFYEMLTGELPGKPIAPPSKKVQIDVRLDEVVLRALERTPELRWQTAAELRTQVETIAATASSAARSQSRRLNSRQVVARSVIAAFTVFLIIFAGNAVLKNLSFPGSSQAELNSEVAALSSVLGSIPNGRTRELLTAMEERVKFVQEAAANDRLLYMADTFNQINEYCDQLQGKNQNVAPPMEEWGVRDSARFREIKDVLAGLENDAEGVRSIVQGRRGTEAERAALLKQIWTEQFMTKYAQLANLLAADTNKLAAAGRQFVRYTVILSVAGRNRFLSLKDARTHATIPSNAPVAYVEKLSDHGWCVIVENGRNYSPERDEGLKLWDSISADEISQPAGLAGVPFERKGIYPLRQDRLPITVLIPEYGLLQINAIDDRTEQVIVEYKHATTNSPAAGSSQQENGRSVGGGNNGQPQPKGDQALKEPTAQEVRDRSVDHWLKRIGRDAELNDPPFTALQALVRKSKQSSEIKEEIVSKAIAVLDDPLENDFRRWQCCYLLSGVGDKRGIPAIARALKHENEIVRGVAVCALGQFDDADARAALEAAARSEKSPRVQQDIQKALRGEFRRKE